MRTAEPLTPSLLRVARREPAVTFLRHGGPCPAAVCPLARPALAEARPRCPSGQSGCGPGGGRPPTPLLRGGQPEDAVARTEPGESPLTLNSRGLS